MLLSECEPSSWVEQIVLNAWSLESKMEKWEEEEYIATDATTAKALLESIHVQNSTAIYFLCVDRVMDKNAVRASFLLARRWISLHFPPR